MMTCCMGPAPPVPACSIPQHVSRAWESFAMLPPGVAGKIKVSSEHLCACAWGAAGSHNCVLSLFFSSMLCPVFPHSPRCLCDQ